MKILDETGLKELVSLIKTALSGKASATHTHTASDVGAAASSHTHAAGDITSGTLGVARGGTGKATHTSNAVLTGNGTGAVNNVATASGALHATSSGGAPSFGTLPIAQGGTGATTAANALSKLGAAASSHTHAATDITSGTLPISRGGTGATTADAARGNLGAAELSNQNLLVNSNYANPIITFPGYQSDPIDNWGLSNGTANVGDGYVMIMGPSAGNGVAHWFQDTTVMAQRQQIGSHEFVTLSACVSANGTDWQVVSATFETASITEDYTYVTVLGDTALYMGIESNRSQFEVGIQVNAEDSVLVKWMKAEDGKAATKYIPDSWITEVDRTTAYSSNTALGAPSNSNTLNSLALKRSGRTVMMAFDLNVKTAQNAGNIANYDLFTLANGAERIKPAFAQIGISPGATGDMYSAYVGSTGKVAIGATRAAISAGATITGTAVWTFELGALT